MNLRFGYCSRTRTSSPMRIRFSSPKDISKGIRPAAEARRHAHALARGHCLVLVNIRRTPRDTHTAISGVFRLVSNYAARRDSRNEFQMPPLRTSVIEARHLSVQRGRQPWQVKWDGRGEWRVSKLLILEPAAAGPKKAGGTSTRHVVSCRQKKRSRRKNLVRKSVTLRL